MIDRRTLDELRRSARRLGVDMVGLLEPPIRDRDPGPPPAGSGRRPAAPPARRDAGEPLDTGTRMGAIVDQRQLEGIDEDTVDQEAGALVDLALIEEDAEYMPII